MSSETILKINNLSKTFRSDWLFKPIKAVQDVSLEVYEKEIFGFLGHNGAGKTTTIKCVLGLIKPTSGLIELNGNPLSSSEQRSDLGYLPEQPYFYDHLSVKELLSLFASLYGLSGVAKKDAIEDAIELLRLEPHTKSRLASLSKGWQQRVGMAQAILAKPKLLLLDEPFSGLDPSGRKEFREIILNLRSLGTTILLSTHILNDIEELCDRVSIMTRGKLWDVIDLKEKLDENYQLIVENSNISTTAKSFLEEKQIDQETDSVRDNLILSCKDRKELDATIRKCVELGLKIEKLQPHSKSLEDLFMESLDA